MELEIGHYGIADTLTEINKEQNIFQEHTILACNTIFCLPSNQEIVQQFENQME